MLKSIGYFLAFIWFMLFITGNGAVMAITFGVIFLGIILQLFIDGIEDKKRKIKNKNG